MKPRATPPPPPTRAHKVVSCKCCACQDCQTAKHYKALASQEIRDIVFDAVVFGNVFSRCVLVLRYQ